jgi:hypothetical protein
MSPPGVDGGHGILIVMGVVMTESSVGAFYSVGDNTQQQGEMLK